MALLSFTNSAVEEARRRCAERPQLLQCPNYVGTIDSFINHFLVYPVFVSRNRLAPVFRDTWRSVPNTNFSVAGIRCMASLQWFDFDLNGRAHLDKKRVPVEQMRAIPDWAATKLEVEASVRWRSFVKRGCSTPKLPGCQCHIICAIPTCVPCWQTFSRLASSK